jgi:hypothetical protein
MKMKRIIRILVIILVIGSLAGVTSSCAVFQGPTHAQNLKPFKHKEPLPKKYIINNGHKAIAK